MSTKPGFSHVSPVSNILEAHNLWVTLSHPKYTKPQKGNKTDRKDAKWICDLYMCGMVKPSFIPPKDICELRDLVRYRFKLTNMITNAISKPNPPRFPVLVLILNQYWYRLQML